MSLQQAVFGDPEDAPAIGVCGGPATEASDERDEAMWQQSVEYRLQSLGDRVGKLDERVERHFMKTWAGIIAATLGLAGLMATGFGWIG